MRTYLECVPCFIQQAIDSAHRVTDQSSVHERLLRETLAVAARMPFRGPPPVMGRLIHRRLRELTGQADPYKVAKQKANAFALKLYPDLKQLVTHSEDPLTAAVKFAIAGNVIDLGVKTGLTENDIHSAIGEAIKGHVDPDTVEELRQAAMSANDILYLADNAGEIVFDRLLIEQMRPGSVTLAVKAGAIINDATREDAEAAGLTDFVEVIDNGDDAPGTILDSCSSAFRRRFDAADLIIAKGQGNYETLNECPHRNLFFLLKAKCAVIARDLKCHVGEMVARKHRMMPRTNTPTTWDEFDWLAEEAHS